MKKTVIYDLNNLAVRCFFSTDVNGNSDSPDFNLWKYRVVEIVYYSLSKFKNVTEVILAIDDTHSWRKVFFPRYKESRKLKRSSDDIDWEEYYKHYEELYSSIGEFLPFKCIKQSRAEADDVIGVLAHYIQNEVIVVSNDSDYLQLCIGKKIKVWNPTKGEYVHLKESREDFITKLCLMGQKKDDIFNVITPNDYPFDLRKPGFGEAAAKKVLKEGLDTFLDKTKKLEKPKLDENKKQEVDEEGNKIFLYKKEFKPREFFKRNQILIDFKCIPGIISENIKEKYDGYKLPNPNNFYSFFKDREWQGFLENYNKIELNLLSLYGS